MQLEENFIEFVYEGITESSTRKVVAALRRVIEVDNLQALVSVALLDEHRVVKELVGPKLNLVGPTDAAFRMDQKNVPSELGEDRGQKAFMDTTRNDQNRWRKPLVHSDWSALCHRLHYGVEQEDWKAAMTVGIKKIEAHELGLEAQ